MDLKSAILVNNVPVCAHQASTGSINSMVDYATREGHFDYGGCDARATADDDRLMGRQDVIQIIDYAAREGQFEHRLAKDAPLRAGERSGGLWGRDGVIDTQKWKQLVNDSRSHIMRSVITVRREDAEILGLDTKEAWQRAVRSTWDTYVRSWGVMDPGNIEWAAAYHVDGRESLHCHIMTIDRSGKWAAGSPRIDREKFVEGFKAVREELYRPYLNRELAEASALRDWMVMRVRLNVFLERDFERELSIEHKLSRSCSLNLPCLAHGLARGEDVAFAKSELLRAIPQQDGKVLSYSRSCKEVREQAKSFVETLIRSDTALSEAYSRYTEIQHDSAQMRGMTGVDLDRGGYVDRESAFVKEHMVDLGKRLANASLGALREEQDRALRTRHHDSIGNASWQHGRLDARELEEVRSTAMPIATRSHLLPATAGLCYEFFSMISRRDFQNITHSTAHFPSRFENRNVIHHTEMSSTRMMER